MKAQMVLGIGGVISTQYDKAIDRLTTVVKNQPNNLEAISWLADAYAGKGDKANASQLIDNLKLVSHLANVGDAKTLIDDPIALQANNERVARAI